MLGYGLVLDWQAPSMCGWLCECFAKYFGSNGGNIAISVMAFCAAALTYYMLYGLSYRYLAVQTDRRLIDYYLKPTSFILLNILGLLISLGVAISVYSATTKPELRF
uniref:NADH dehydrogenase subunit 2 n=1 Tax=Ditylenchus dipsaci TaxID=166011 RepID=A0A915DX43_9BILA